MKTTVKTMASLAASLFFFSQCQQPGGSNSNAAAADSTVQSPAIADSTLMVSLQADSVYQLTDSISVLFTVSNRGADSLRFTQYHTPFEGFMSNFLTITDADGKEVAYVGPMTRRIMPPPADTYHTVAPGQADSIRFNVAKGYRFEKAGTYSLQYNSGAISGLDNGQAIQIRID